MAAFLAVWLTVMAASASAQTWYPNEGDLYYDGSLHGDSFLRWLDPGNWPTADTAYEHDWAIYPAFFGSCTSWTNLPSDYNDCPTAGVREQPPYWVFSFGSFHVQNVQTAKWYFGEWDFGCNPPSPCNPNEPSSPFELKAQAIDNTPACLDWIWCLSGQAGSQPLKSGTLVGGQTYDQTWGSTLPPRIGASPNPVPASDGLGSTTISFSTGNGTGGQVWVSANGAPESLFASGAGHSQSAPWISSGSTYVFRLYQGTTHSTVLASVTVTRQVGGVIYANPNPVPPGGEFGSTTINWDILGDYAEVWVADLTVGGNEVRFAQGASGQAVANWIQTGHQYVFRLYAGQTHTQVVNSVTVTKPS